MNIESWEEEIRKILWEKKRENIVYISGALTDMPEEKRQELREFYDRIGMVCQEFGLIPYLPHISGDPQRLPNVTPEQINIIDRRAVTQSILVIAYIGVPSLGVGIEIELAYHSYKSLILIYEKKALETKPSRISRLVRAHPAVIAHIVFETKENVYDELRKTLKEYIDNERALPWLPGILKI